MVKTEYDQQNFDQFYRDQATATGVWIGISDRENPGEMAWNDGDYVGYKNWAMGEPDITMDQFKGRGWQFWKFFMPYLGQIENFGETFEYFLILFF